MVFDRMPYDPAFVGIPTFLKLPLVTDKDQLAAERPDIVIIGAPFDMAVNNRPGARYGPKAIRAASNLGRGIHHPELGGDHSVTLPAATAIADAVGRGKLGIVHFDAHADTAPDNWGVLLGHGTPMRRLIESGAVPGRSFVQVGLRGYWPPPDVIEWMRAQEMRWHQMDE